jgi:Gig2-like
MQTSPELITPLPDDVPGEIRDVKRRLRKQLGDPRAALEVAVAAVQDAVAEVVAERAESGSAVPIVDYDDVAAGTVPAERMRAIHRRGCAVVRGTFERGEAEAWDEELAAYLDRNDFTARYRGPADELFSALASSRPQIYGVYWSRPQIAARQHERMVTVRRFLNSFWMHESDGQQWFDPDHDIGYPDRIRRRQPSTPSLGLSPHADNGSIERWLLPAYRQVYRHVFSGEWERYDPWDGAHRGEIHEYPTTVMCSAFRTFQGWTALSEMRPGDGVLHVVPIPQAMGYLLLRALQDDVADDDLCGADNDRVLAATEQHHDVILPAYGPIPAVEPGDTVWWHVDLIHGVGDGSNEERWGNVMYIPTAPWCDKNAAYARQCGEAFLAGRSPADFAAEDYEVDFTGRATLDDLDEVGRAQLALG